MEIITKNINDLHGAEYNPRIALKPGDPEFEKIARSIEEFGYVDPVIINKDGTIIGGHQRCQVLKSLGFTEIKCVIVDLDKNKEKALNIALNKITGAWDNDKLKDLLIDLDKSDLDATLTGFDSDELAKIIGDIELEEDPLNDDQDFDQDQAEDDLEKEGVKTQPGDIWLLGDNRLLCGDSTKKEDITRLMNGEKADLVFTDPPYGMKKAADGVLNDNLNYDDLLEFNKKWVPISFDALGDVGSWYCWGIDEVLMDLYAFILRPMKKKDEITWRNLITWDKGHGQGENSEQHRQYATADEKCLFVVKGVQGFNTNSDHYFEGFEPIRKYLYDSRMAMGWDIPTMKRAVGHSDISLDHWTSPSQWTMPTRDVYEKMQAAAESQRQEKGLQNDAFMRSYDDLNREYLRIKEQFKATFAYFDNTHDNMTNVWHFERTSQKERELTGGHATPKPLDLCARAIISSCKKGGLVLDLFGGSGSTLIASQQNGRRCYMNELSPKYCDVIIKRWQHLTGKDAILEKTQKKYNEV